jgi:peptidoglycan/LPS O-acetylase OafA/YrhL
MSIKIESLLNILAPAIIIILSIIINNGSNQLDKARGRPSSNHMFFLSIVIFIFGCFMLAVSLGKNVEKTKFVYVSSAIIVFSVTVMMSIIKFKKSDNKNIIMGITGLFITGLLSLGYYSAGKNGMLLTLSSSICIIISILFILPWQRNNKIIDGPGMPLFTGSFVLLALGNLL